MAISTLVSKYLFNENSTEFRIGYGSSEITNVNVSIDDENEKLVVIVYDGNRIKWHFKNNFKKEKVLI